MKLVWDGEAIADRSNVHTISRPTIQGSLAQDELFSEKAERLNDQPKFGRNSRVASIRELVAYEHYIMVCDLDSDTI